MASETAISWCDATFNPWIGCSHAGPGCDFCYAERDNNRRHWVAGWGPGVPRRRTSDANWKMPLRWNNNPAKLIGDQWPARKPRVFAASLADIFDNEVDDAWRAEFFELVRTTPNLQWLIVTKRIGNAAKMLPRDWRNGYANAVLIATVVDQREADRDIPKLLATPAAARGVSIEPMLGEIVLQKRWLWIRGAHCLDWVICGGESGPHARPMHPAWPRLLRDQCGFAGVPFHFKQWGEHVPAELVNDTRPEPWRRTQDGRENWAFDELGKARADLPPIVFQKVGTKIAGRLLDGVEHNGFVRQGVRA